VNKRQWPLHNLQLNCVGNAAIFHIAATCTKVSLFLCLLWLRKFICLLLLPFFRSLLLLSCRTVCWIADVPIFQKAEHYNGSSPVRQPAELLLRQRELPEPSLHVVAKVTTSRILKKLVDGMSRRGLQDEGSFNKSREIFHVIVCVSVSVSSRVISHESFRDYFLEAVVTS